MPGTAALELAAREHVVGIAVRTDRLVGRWFFVTDQRGNEGHGAAFSRTLFNRIPDREVS